MGKNIVLLIALILISLTIHSQTISRQEKRADSLRCFSNDDMKVINGVFVDLDDCEAERDTLYKIISLKNEMLKSKIDLIDTYKQQESILVSLKTELHKNVDFANQISDLLSKEYKEQNKKMKKQNNKIAGCLGAGVALGLLFGLLNIFKVY